MRAGILAFSEAGEALGRRMEGFFLGRGDGATCTRCPSGGLFDWTKAHFSSDDVLVFVGSCGIAVRAIAPLIHSKCQDPAVLVVDDSAAFCVSLLSGHIGGGNRLAEALAAFLSATPVVTTATDRRGVFSVDDWAARQGFTIANPDRIKTVSSRLLAGERLGIRSDFPIKGPLPKGLYRTDGKGDILITYQRQAGQDALVLIPPAVTLGVGARKGIDEAALEAAYLTVLQRANCHPAAVFEICSIDLKANEPGILAFAAKRRLPYRTAPAEALSRVEGSVSPSDFVLRAVGVDNVCERSALLGCGPGGRLIAPKTAGQGVTMALALKPLPIVFLKGAFQ